MLNKYKKSLYNTIKQNKFNIFVWLIGLLVVLVFVSPHILGYLLTPDSYVFVGQAAWFDPWDINVYISAIKWAQKYGFYFQNTFTTVEHKSVFFYPLYTITGVLFKKQNVFFLFHFLKFVFGLILFYSIYKLSHTILYNRKDALLCSVLASFAGGLGWLAYGKYLLPDLSITPFILYSAYEKPHEALALAFYLISLYFVYKTVAVWDRKQALKSGLAFLPVIIFYPYYLLSYYLISIVYAFIQSKDIRKTLFIISPIFVTFLPGLFYSYYLLSAEVSENVTAPYLGTPNIIFTVLGFGIIVPAIFYMMFLQKDKRVIFLLAWFFVSFALAYTPLSFARYYLRGLFVPGSLILFIVARDLNKRLKIRSVTLKLFLVLFLIMTNLLIYSARISNVFGQKYYISDAKMELIKATVGDNTSNVLSSIEIGNLIPAFTINRVYYGHNFQTPDAESKKAKLTEFFSKEYEDEEARKFLKENNIDFVVWSEEEKALAGDTANLNLEYLFLETVFTNSAGSVYSVNQ